MLATNNTCLIMFDFFSFLWVGGIESISRIAMLHVVGSDGLCMLVAGLLGAFIAAFILRRTHRGPGLNIRELMYGRIKLMTTLCPAWAHTHQQCASGTTKTSSDLAHKTVDELHKVSRTCIDDHQSKSEDLESF